VLSTPTVGVLDLSHYQIIMLNTKKKAAATHSPSAEPINWSLLSSVVQNYILESEVGYE